MSTTKEKMLEFIKIYRNKEGHAPSFAELARALGVRRSTITDHFQKRYSADFCEIDDYYKRFLK